MYVVKAEAHECNLIPSDHTVANISNEFMARPSSSEYLLKIFLGFPLENFPCSATFKDQGVPSICQHNLLTCKTNSAMSLNDMGLQGNICTLIGALIPWEKCRC